jgi:hypothetical protein
MSLQFGSITFTNPVKLAQWRPDDVSGLYCVCVANRNWQPVPYQPLYFGIAKNLAEENLLGEQVALDAWTAHAGSPNKLLVAHAGLPYFSMDDLLLFERKLVAQYQPACNHFDVPSDLSIPLQRKSDVLTKYDRVPLAVVTEIKERKYA